MPDTDPMLSTRSALARAVAGWARVALRFAESERWHALIESLERLSETFDFLGVLPGVGLSSEAEPVDLDPDALGERIGVIFEDVLRSDGVPEDDATWLVGAGSVRALPGGGDLADAIEDLQLRVRLAGGSVALLVGAGRISIGTARFEGDTTSIETDLAGLKRALELIGLALLRRFRDPKTCAFELPDIHGRIEAALSFTGAQRFALAFALAQPLGLVFRAAGRPYGLAIQPSADAVTMVGDAERGTLELGIAVDRLSFAFGTVAGGVAELIVPGLSAGLHFADGNVIHVHDIGLGRGVATVEVDGERLVTWDLNEGRSLSAELEPLSDALRIAVEPECKLRVALNLGSVGAELGLPESVVIDSGEARLDGAVAVGRDGVVVRSGSLTVESKNAGSVKAGNGQTMRLRDGQPGEHPLRRLVVGMVAEQRQRQRK